MFTLNKITLATLTSLLAATSIGAHAASLDFRHEYKHESKADNNRIKFSHTHNKNHKFGVEMKFNNTKEGNYWWSNLERGDSEFTYEYVYMLNDKWGLQPGIPITMGEDKITFKPQLAVFYKFDNGVRAKLRYRHGIVDDSDGSSPDYDYGQFTSNITYTWNKKVNFDFEANYYDNYGATKDNGSPVNRYDNKDTNYELNLKVGYKIPNTNWRPYVEFGDVSVSSSDDNRQLRSRIGVTYSFK